MTTRTEYAGRGWSNNRPGKRITDISQFHVGQLVLQINAQFHARNVVKITHTFEGMREGHKVYGTFMRPENVNVPWTTEKDNFCIWHHELKSDKYYAVKE